MKDDSSALVKVTSLLTNCCHVLFGYHVNMLVVQVNNYNTVSPII